MRNPQYYLRACAFGVFLILSVDAYAAGRIGPPNSVADFTIPVPVQNYAVIDLSGNTATTAVNSIALDNNNNAAFGFGTGRSGDFETFAQYHTYTWQNGQSTACPVTNCTNYPTPTDPPSPHWDILVSGIIPNGSITGEKADSGTGSAEDLQSICSDWSATPIPDIAPIPLAMSSGANSDSEASICSESNNGNLAGGWYGIDLNGVEFGVIYNKTLSGWTVFDGYGEFGEPPCPISGTLPPNSTVNTDDFLPAEINDNAWAVGIAGYQSYFAATVPTNVVWTPSGYPNFGVDQPSEINNQNQVMVNSDFGEAYLWEGGTATQSGSSSFLAIDEVPYEFSFQIHNATSQDFSKWISDQESDGTIQILATAQNSGDSTDPSGPDPTEYFVWKRDHSAKWSLAKVQLPDGVTIDRYDTINPNGIIAALGKPNTAATSDHALLLVPAELVPDYNHDGKIDDSDRGKVTTDNPYRYWVNDDSDSTGDDVPADTTSPDGQQVSVQGMGDLEDFFPLFLDIKTLLKILPAGQFSYTLKNADSNLRFVYTDLIPNNSGQYLTTLSGAQADNAIALQNATAKRITSDGVALTSDFLNKIQNGTGGIILVEGRGATTSPLVLEVDQGSQMLVQIKLPLSISGVEQMYRQINLMRATGASGGYPTSLGEPQNYPDSLCSNKKFVFVHGYNVNPSQARGWNAEVFKRMYWSGSRAKFYGVTWNGAQTQQINTFTPDYQKNVNNAFATAEPFAKFVNGLGGDVTVCAHSLGNMLVSSAIQDWGANISNYYMVDAAVSLEAYDGSIATESAMTHPDWSSYQTNVWASEWYLDSAFSSGDARKTLTWRDRLSNVGANTYNFYSGSEDVLRKHEGDPSIISVLTTAVTGGRYAWALQEKLKGRRVNVPVPGLTAFVGSTYGGWLFSLNPLKPGTPSPSQAALLTDASLTTDPVFDPGFTTRYSPPPPSGGRPPEEIHSGAPNWIIALTGAATGSSTASSHRSQLLAEMFPARTLPMGGEGGSQAASIVGQNLFDMPALYITDSTQWPRKTQYNGDVEWLHSDIKNMAYPQLYQIYKKFVSIGGLQQ